MYYKNLGNNYFHDDIMLLVKKQQQAKYPTCTKQDTMFLLICGLNIPG